MITLGNAAKTLGISKPALSKAISRGHLSAHKREDGSFSIDPAELMRWWEGARHRFQGADPVHASSHFHGTTPSENSEKQSETPANAGNGADTSPEVAARLAALEEQVKGLRELLDEVRRSREETAADRDHWREQAVRVVKALPAPESKTERRSVWEHLSPLVRRLTG
jgi:excisionase family DNA binding protein